METYQIILLIPLIIFPVTLIILYQSYKTNRMVNRQRLLLRSRASNDSYARRWERMEESQHEGYRPSRRISNPYRSGLTADRAGTSLHNIMEQYYKAEQERAQKEEIESAKQKEKEEKLKLKKEREEQRIKKEKLAYKKPGRSSRVEKAARILDELEDSKKRKVK